MKKTIISVVGKDKVAIIARVCTYLADNQVNIEEISQTILQGVFTMTMIVDLAGSDAGFQQVSDELAGLSGELGVQITFQREEVFRFMYRL